MNYNVVKEFSSTTLLAEKSDKFFILKKISVDDSPLFRAMTDIKSVHLAKVYEMITIENDIFAVMEYIPGETLKDYVEKHGKLTEEETIRITFGVALGLKKLHSKKIIHRDINPNNIIIDRTGNSVIIDYGISRIQKKESLSDTTVLGTAGFTAPEQYGFKQTTPQTDIYSLGVLMGYMLTGVVNPHTDSENKINCIIKKATLFNPEERYKNIDEFLRSFPKKNLKETNTETKTGFVNRAGLCLFGFYYICFIFLFVISAAEPNPLPAEMLSFFFFLAGLPPICFCNIMQWQYKIPFLKNFSSKTIRSVFIVIGLISMLTALVLVII